MIVIIMPPPAAGGGGGVGDPGGPVSGPQRAPANSAYIDAITQA